MQALSLSIRKHHNGYRVVTADLKGRPSTFAAYPTRDAAERARLRLQRINEAAALAVDAAEDAIARVARAARIPRREAIAALRDVLACS